MAIKSASDKILTMGDRSYASDYVPFTNQIVRPNDTGTNAPAVKASFDALTYVSSGDVGTTADFSIAFEDEQVVVAGNCGVGEIDRSAKKVPTFNIAWYDVANLDAWAYVHGYKVENVAGTLVSGSTQDVVNPSAYLSFIVIDNQNGDGSAITVNSVTGSTDGALVAGTDYEVVQAGGKYGIQLISGGAITTLTQTFTINYDYTPNATRLLPGFVEGQSIPYGVYKFTGCVQETNTPGEGVRNVLYMEKFFASTPANLTFIKRPEEELTAVDTAVTAADGAIWLWAKETVAL